MATVSIGKRMIGDGEPVYIIAEIGINHNGSLKKAMKLVKSARNAGCDCVKFQKRTPSFVFRRISGILREILPGKNVLY